MREGINALCSKLWPVSDSHQETNPLQPLSADLSQAQRSRKSVWSYPTRQQCKCVFFRNWDQGLERWLRCYYRGPGSLLCIHIVVHNHVLTPVSGNFWQKHEHSKQTNAGKTIIHIKIVWMRMVSSWWNRLGRIRRYSLVWGGMSLVTGFRVSKAHHATPT